MTAFFARTARLSLKAAIVILFLASLFAGLAPYLPLPDDFAPSLLLEFGPRWLLFLGLLPVLWLDLPRVLKAGVALLAISLALWTLDYRLAGCGPPPEKLPTLKLGTYNVGEGTVLPAQVVLWYRVEALDVLLLQEVSPILDWRTAAEKTGMQLICHSKLCVLTQHAVKLVRALDRDTLGGWGSYVAQYTFCVQQNDCVPVINVHLDTPRHAIEAVLDHKPLTVVKEMMHTRELESIVASLLTDSQRALIAGDFNMTEQSSLYRRYWKDWRNAFALSGCGFGHTKFTRLLSARIDHILAGRDYEILGAKVHQSFGGDHRPVTASFWRRWVKGDSDT